MAEVAAYAGAVLTGMGAIEGGAAAASPSAGDSYLEVGLLLAGLPAVAYIVAKGFVHSMLGGVSGPAAPASPRARPRAAPVEAAMMLGVLAGALAFAAIMLFLRLPVLDTLLAAALVAVGVYRLAAVRLSAGRRTLDERQRA